MRTRLLLSVSLLCASLCAQGNFVTNGDFSAGITGWTEGGVSYNPLVELYDTDGFTTSASYGCGAGGAVYAPPHASNWIEQSILQVPTVSYEFSADVSVHGSNGNAHAGACYVEVNGAEVGRFDFSSFTANKTEGNRLCFRYTTSAVGMVNLRVNFVRPSYIFTATTPRMHIDNISVQFAQTPTFAIPANRQIGTSLPFNVEAGTAFANAPYAILIAAAEQNPPIQLPGVNGTLGLDLLTLAILASGNLDSSGKASNQILVPALPALTSAATWFQGAAIGGSTLYLGFHHGLAFVN